MSMATTPEGSTTLAAKKALHAETIDRPVRSESSSALGHRLGDVLVAPIAQGGDFSRYAGFVESLTGAGCTTQGAARVNKVRRVDLVARGTRKIEPAPKAVIDDAIFRFLTVFESFHRI